MSVSTSCVTLSNGLKMPLVGLGTWKSKTGEVAMAVETAIKAGYRHIVFQAGYKHIVFQAGYRHIGFQAGFKHIVFQVGYKYIVFQVGYKHIVFQAGYRHIVFQARYRHIVFQAGYRHIDCAAVYGNEVEVGAGIKAGGVARDQLFITSKLWNTKHHPEDVEAACRATLSDLGLEYLDLYLIHWPTAFQRGDDKFPKNEDGTLKYDDISPVESHPYLNQSRLLEFCKERGIYLTAYSPLGSPDRPWAKPDEPKLLDDLKISKMAEKYKKSPAQIVLGWQVQRGVIVIPKSVTPTRIVENADIFDFKLTEEEMVEMAGFDCNGRVVIPMVDGKPSTDNSASPRNRILIYFILCIFQLNFCLQFVIASYLMYFSQSDFFYDQIKIKCILTVSGTKM
ncbi:alcohol dehydrogenase [NADP(+)] [Eurytemora carolleeae]|uniref:alcohol dehydrogenase [NADP(+)] n=1 Tax=Eurytemora carolleeae TaxID=1294199 RepID=UPI000C7909FE|nr:alcohol dehydrogenase [NADP(+)] [Eurytemora carolleeae]|eukprot:XP_023336743.1 alcohol dehydrogenase [NADP(+)]-like [Eurytemora affinis]